MLYVIRQPPRSTDYTSQQQSYCGQQQPIVNLVGVDSGTRARWIPRDVQLVSRRSSGLKENLIIFITNSIPADAHSHLKLVMEN